MQARALGSVRGFANNGPDPIVGGVVAETTPKTLTKDELKDVARTIVLRQGNRYVKELLRKHKIPMGLTKADFLQHMSKAIDDDQLTQPMIEDWLAEVEGWGNQHAYLYEPPSIPLADLATILQASTHAPLLASAASYDFPEELLLTGITLTSKSLSLVWHLGNFGWERAQDRDFQKEEDDDLYEYRAFRERADRSVVRFEWRFADPCSAILIQLPHTGALHSGAIGTVFDDLTEIGIIDAPLTPRPLSEAVKKSTKDKKMVVQSTKMGAPGGYVELAATAAGAGIEQIQGVRETRKAVNDKLFPRADGMFTFTTGRHPKISMPVKTHVYGSESRIKIWAQCKREDVYLVMRYFWSK
jgi:hypothetical protein